MFGPDTRKVLIPELCDLLGSGGVGIIRFLPPFLRLTFKSRYPTAADLKSRGSAESFESPMVRPDRTLRHTSPFIVSSFHSVHYPWTNHLFTNFPSVLRFSTRDSPTSPCRLQSRKLTRSAQAHDLISTPPGSLNRCVNFSVLHD